MRGFVVVAILVGGCYRPTDPACVIGCTIGAADSCPSDLICGTASLCESPTGPTCNGLLDALPVDEGTDDPDAPDAPVQVVGVCPPDAFSSRLARVVVDLAGDYTPTANRTRVSIATSSDIRVSETGIDLPDVSDYPTVAPLPATATELYSTHIDGIGETLYFTADESQNETYVYRLVRQSAGVWNQLTRMHVKIAGQEVVLALGVQLGAPATIGMVHRFPTETTTGFEEYEEATNDLVRIATTSKAMLGVNTLDDPSFTPNGLNVVFTGSKALETGIFVAHRPMLTSPWSPAILVRTHGLNTEITPNLSDDCRYLYWGSQGRVLEAIAP